MASLYETWKAENPQATKATSGTLKSQRYDMKLRCDVIEAYGGACACCGTTFFAHLTLDHVNGGGRREREGQKSPGKDTYRVLRRMLPALDPDFQVMCFNCNWAKHRWGSCQCQGGGDDLSRRQ